MTPAHMACSAGETRNRPRWPEVPDERPTVKPSTVGVKSRLCSAARATDMAAAEVMPQVLKAPKLAIIAALSTVGSVRQ